MRICRLRLSNFRGWSELDLRPQGHVVLAGVPRSGRSDVIRALARVLDPATARTQPDIADLRIGPIEQVAADAGVDPAGGDLAEGATDSANAEPVPAGDATPNVTRSPFALVEVVLTDLDPDLEQLFDGYLEPCGADGLPLPDGVEAGPNDPWCARIAYRVSYDSVSDSLAHVVYFPVASQPATESYTRVPSAARQALPVVVVSAARPLQLRAEGVLRRLAVELDPEGTATALADLQTAVAQATADLVDQPAIADALQAVLDRGLIGERLVGESLGADVVGFAPEDGSLAALLRAIQPTLALDGAGSLSLPSHGSTTSALIASAEALLLARVPGAVVIADDFGDLVDGATAEHLAAILRDSAEQVWLSTRRHEVVRAFAPQELVRLTADGGQRSHHQMGIISDRKKIVALRLLHTQVLPAMTSPVVAIVEGPQDLAAYSAVDRRRSGTQDALALAGVRLISADVGSGGGTTQVPRIAALARSLGFFVVALIDNDPQKTNNATVLPSILAVTDAVVRLPTGQAVEEALLAGWSLADLRSAAGDLTVFGVPDPTIGVSDQQLRKQIAAVLHKQSLHEPYLESLYVATGQLPPGLCAALDAIVLVSRPLYVGPGQIDLS